MARILPTLYDHGSPYLELMNNITHIYQQTEKLYDILVLKISDLESMGMFWDAQYQEVISALAKRESARKDYDHYDQKMEEQVKQRNIKLLKNQHETQKEVEYFDRVLYYISNKLE